MDREWISVRHARMPLEKKCCNMIAADDDDDNDDVMAGKLHVCMVQPLPVANHHSIHSTDNWITL